MFPRNSRCLIMADGWSEMRQDRPATKKLEPRSHCDKSNGYSVVPPPLPPPRTHAHPHISLSVVRPDMFTHASQLLHLQVRSIGHHVMDATVHYLGCNIFCIYIYIYFLINPDFAPLCFCLKRIIWSVKATRAQ